MRRMAMVTRLRADRVAEYEALHRAVWPEVLAGIAACHIRDYTIFLRRPELLLFGTWEYHGSDFEADMAQMRADPATQAWWRLTDPCQEPVPSHKGEGRWAPMAEVFHVD